MVDDASDVASIDGLTTAAFARTEGEETYTETAFNQGGKAATASVKVPARDAKKVQLSLSAVQEISKVADATDIDVSFQEKTKAEVGEASAELTLPTKAKEDARDGKAEVQLAEEDAMITLELAKLAQTEPCLVAIAVDERSETSYTVAMKGIQQCATELELKGKETASEVEVSRSLEQKTSLSLAIQKATEVKATEKQKNEVATAPEDTEASFVLHEKLKADEQDVADESSAATLQLSQPDQRTVEAEEKVIEITIKRPEGTAAVEVELSEHVVNIAKAELSLKKGKMEKPEAIKKEEPQSESTDTATALTNKAAAEAAETTLAEGTRQDSATKLDISVPVKPQPQASEAEVAEVATIADESTAHAATDVEASFVIAPEKAEEAPSEDAEKSATIQLAEKRTEKVKPEEKPSDEGMTIDVSINRPEEAGAVKIQLTQLSFVEAITNADISKPKKGQEKLTEKAESKEEPKPTEASKEETQLPEEAIASAEVQLLTAESTVEAPEDVEVSLTLSSAPEDTAVVEVAEAADSATLQLKREEAAADASLEVGIRLTFFLLLDWHLPLGGDSKARR